MTKHVIDAYAWIEYLDRSDAGRKVTAILENNDAIYTCAVTLGEVISKVARVGKDTKVAYDILSGNSQIVIVDEELSLQAGLLHFEMLNNSKDLGLADAYVLATARKLKAKILTGDEHFKPVKEAVMIK
jgi:predicted nucleic acid-binding protein